MSEAEDALARARDEWHHHPLLSLADNPYRTPSGAEGVK